MRRFLLVLSVVAGLASACDERENGAPVVSLAECTELGGEPINDPGDGSTFEMGCGAERILLGYLDSAEGGEGICCEVL